MIKRKLLIENTNLWFSSKFENFLFYSSMWFSVIILGISILALWNETWKHLFIFSKSRNFSSFVYSSGLLNWRFLFFSLFAHYSLIKALHFWKLYFFHLLLIQIYRFVYIQARMFFVAKNLEIYVDIVCNFFSRDTMSIF